MDNMLHIGSKIDKETSDNAAQAIVSVIKASYEARLSDEVMIKALSSLTSILEVKNVTISNCAFDNDQSKTVEVIVPEGMVS